MVMGRVIIKVGMKITLVNIKVKFIGIYGVQCAFNAVLITVKTSCN